MAKALDQTRSILNSAADDPQLLAILTRYGYGYEYLQEGIALCDSARISLQTQSKMRLNKVVARQAFQKNWEFAMLHYNNDLRLARVALKSYSGSSYFLQLNGTRAKEYEAWYEQAQSFYFGLRAEPEMHSLIEQIGLTAERIDHGVQLLQRLDADYQQRKVEKNNSVKTMQQRNEAFLALDRWMFTFRAIARTVLANQPAYLAKLGLEPKSSKAKKKEEVLQVKLSTLDTAHQFSMVQ